MDRTDIPYAIAFLFAMFVAMTAEPFIDWLMG